MNIEKDVFKRCSVNYDKLIQYGFTKNNDSYIYEKEFLDNSFKAIIKIDKDGIINGKVIDNETLDEYTNIRLEISGEFVNKVREEYKNILLDIRNNCFDNNYFISEQANRITKYIKDKYLSDPEFLWDKFKGYGVFRNNNNNKWFGIIMNIDLAKLSNGSGEVEIINVKIKENKVSDLLNKKGYFKAYHMNKKDWISIVLNDTLKDNEILLLVDESYQLINDPEEWIVPANPKYYDIIKAFNDNDEILWKQSSDIHINDIVYLYVAEPYSKIMFKCIATEVKIPYEYQDKNLSMNYVMKIKLLKKYLKDEYTFEYLKSIGIKSIRGPRKINKTLLIK